MPAETDMSPKSPRRAAETRGERRAAALRANLKKRKQQARFRAAEADAEARPDGSKRLPE